MAGTTETNDFQLLQQYAQKGSEDAFKALVDRNLKLVYSVALSRLANESDAKDITQVVFAALASKAGHLSERVILSGWLFQVTTHACQDLKRAEARRKKRETTAMQQQTTQSNPGHPETDEVAPMVTRALTSLATSERDAILLRFLEEHDFRQVGARLGISEAAAKMRVTRGLEKLRQLLQKRGITISEAVLCGAFPLMMQSVPAGIRATIKAGTVQAALSPSNTALLKGVLKAMAWAKLKTAGVISVAFILAAGTATTLAVKHQHQAKAQTDFPKSSWAFAGYADPVEALETSFWASSRKDGPAMVASLTPELTEQIRQHLGSDLTQRGMSLEHFFATRKNPLIGMSGFRVVSQERISNGEVRLHVTLEGKENEQVFGMKKIRSEWKVNEYPPNF